MPPETMHTQDPPAGTTPVDHFQRIPYQPADDGRIEMHSGLSRHYPTLHANLVELPGSSRRRGVIMCHPASNFLSHFLLAALARADQPAMGLNTRYANNEPALLMERAAADLGTGIRWMREELGFERVVLLGFSGGGSLATFHQSRARGVEAADAVMLVGAHPGRARVLRHWIDPSVTDEDDPWSVDPELDLFAAGRSAPFDPEWVERYRAAQSERMRRIDRRALEALERLEKEGGSDRGFVVHRTTADPRFLDLTLDPSDREAGSMYGDPAAANTAAGGLARFVTARSWLSTWSPEHTAADALTDLTRITDPTLVMSLLGDQAAFAEESRLMAACSADPRVELVEMRHLNHYLVDQPEGLDSVISGLLTWMDTRLSGSPAPHTAQDEEGLS
ncbi:alpha/beta hydrolase [Dietzia sp. B32]|uniref:alpha/beta hydrolase n=1 Tax=Dietzia sp. B32 TaxID=2915130 RepID=UPI0021AE0E69|nr:alpha/beta hydrolase [Dietzia sp. B32]UVE96238.1 alpha/beta hydrolase [Dietzia sp. B32]